MTRVCSVDGCTGERDARGLCGRHYMQAKRAGELPGLMPAVYPSVADRLVAGLRRQPNGCLEWTEGRFSTGYGAIKNNGKQLKTHRVAWELVNGPIPPGLRVCHHCDNPPCCQTDPTPGYPNGHLFLGTDADNAADRDTKGRGVQPKTHCPQGHPYSGSNLYVNPTTGTRACRRCGADCTARRKARRKGQTANPVSEPWYNGTGGEG